MTMVFWTNHHDFPFRCTRHTYLFRNREQRRPDSLTATQSSEQVITHDGDRWHAHAHTCTPTHWRAKKSAPSWPLPCSPGKQSPDLWPWVETLSLATFQLDSASVHRGSLTHRRKGLLCKSRWREPEYSNVIAQANTTVSNRMLCLNETF